MPLPTSDQKIQGSHRLQIKTSPLFVSCCKSGGCPFTLKTPPGESSLPTLSALLSRSATAQASILPQLDALPRCLSTLTHARKLSISSIPGSSSRNLLSLKQKQTKWTKWLFSHYLLDVANPT